MKAPVLAGVGLLAHQASAEMSPPNAVKETTPVSFVPIHTLTTTQSSNGIGAERAAD